MKLLCTTLSVLSVFVVLSNGSSILGIFHSVSKSHYFVAAALMRELVARGHQVTTVSPFYLDAPAENYTEIVIGGVLESTKSTMNSLVDLRDSSAMNRLRKLYAIGRAMTEATFQEDEFKKLLSAGQHFDLIVIDITMNDAFMGLGHQFKAPIVGLTTIGATMWSCDLVGTPAPFSFVPYPYYSFTNEMNYRERLINVLLTTLERFYYNYVFLPEQEKLYDENFPDPKPNLNELRKNVSLVLLNTHFTLHYPRPYVPNMIEVGGMQVNRKRKSLPRDIVAFLDSAKHGVVYFSMGSNIKCGDFSRDTLDGIIRVISALKEKVLWKCELENHPGITENILIRKWLPQDDILAHPNVKLFISHGGLLSTTEAIYHGVPVLGIPSFADQFQNMAMAVRAGFAFQLDFDELSGEKLAEGLTTVLSDPKYAANAKSASRRYRDQPLNPLDTAVYWVEYVIRHKGAPHMRSKSQDLNLFEYYSVDTIGVLIGSVLIVMYLLLKLLKKCFIILLISCLNLNVKEKVN